MEAELLSLDEQMKNEIKECKDKYSLLKKQVREKYKNIEKNLTPEGFIFDLKNTTLLRGNVEIITL